MMTLRTFRPFLIGLSGLLILSVLAEAQRPSGRPSGGGGSRPSSSGASRPSASRPSTPSYSRPSAPTSTRASAPSSYQRGSAAPAQRPSTPQPSAPQPSAPRYEQPSAPRYQPAPRYEQPSAPRYEQPSSPYRHQPSAPRYEAPDSGRADAPGNRDSTPTIRVYDGAERGPGSARDGSGRGPSQGRASPGGRPGTDEQGPSEPSVGRARIERADPANYLPRVWQPAPVVDLSSAVRPPRARVPELAGSRSGSRTEGGLASGRLERAGIDASRAAAAMPHRELTPESLRERYGTAAEASKGSSSRAAPSSGGLSEGRARAAEREADKAGRAIAAPERGEDGRKSGREVSDRGGVRRGGSTNAGGLDPADSAGRVGRTLRGIDERERKSPGEARRWRDAGTAVRDGAAAGAGIVVGCWSGWYGGWCGDPWSDWCWDSCDPYWNSCWSGSWWWSWCWYWPYGSCWWGPSYGWGYRPWWGYPSYGWCWSPAVYTTVIYESSPAVVYQEPAAVAPAVEIAPVGPAGAVAKPAPEVSAALAVSAQESLDAGDLAFREGRYSDAVRHYARAVECQPDKGSHWLILSDALFATGDYHYAAYAFRRSLELDARLLEPAVDKHSWYTDPAEFDRHIAWAEAFLRDHVLDEDARLVLAANYLFARRPAQAVDCLASAFGAGLMQTQSGQIVHERARRALGLGGSAR